MKNIFKIFFLTLLVSNSILNAANIGGAQPVVQIDIPDIHQKYTDIHYYLTDYRQYLMGKVRNNLSDNLGDFETYLNQLDQERQEEIANLIRWFHKLIKNDEEEYFLNKANKLKGLFAGVAFLSAQKSYLAQLGMSSYGMSTELTMLAISAIASKYVIEQIGPNIEWMVQLSNDEYERFRHQPQGSLQAIREEIVEYCNLDIFTKVMIAICRYAESLNWCDRADELKLNYDSIEKLARRQNNKRARR